MKKRKLICYIMMFLPLVINLAALPFLPEKIPAHYGFDNQVDRWGSKYEALLYPIVTILMGYYFLAMARVAAKQEENGENNEKVLLAASIITMAVFNVLNGYSLYTDFKKVENLSEVPVNLYQLLFGILGVFMIIIGNIMPKLRMNSMIGLRTKWSMQDEVTWKKSQRFGGISFIIGGIAVIAICFMTKGFVCVLWSMAVIGVLLVVDVCYTRKAARLLQADNTSASR